MVKIGVMICDRNRKCTGNIKNRDEILMKKNKKIAKYFISKYKQLGITPILVKQNYIDAHQVIGDWKKDNLEEYVKPLTLDIKATQKYDSTRPDYLKEKYFIK